MLRVENLPDHRIAYKVTEYGTIAHDKRSGEVANTYGNRRLISPLKLWHTNTMRVLAKAIKYHKPPRRIAKIKEIGIDQELYDAGQRYGALWREVCQPRSPAHSDTTRIIVDGGSAIPDPVDYMAGDSELREAQQAIHDEETVAFLNRICGMEDWPSGDKRRFKRKCRRGLETLAMLWRRR